MIIDLETERRNGLDESQLARDVMRFMRLSETCSGAQWIDTNTDWFYCKECGAEFSDGLPVPHPRVPKPLREVRDELITWLQSRQMSVAMEYRKDGTMAVGVRNCNGNVWANCWTSFDNVADTGRAIALAAVRLLGEKQGG